MIIAALMGMAAIAIPPKEYQQDDTYLVRTVADPRAECPSAGYHQFGCAIGSVVILPNPCSKEFRGEKYAAMACHEFGHPQGWGHD